jgi:hypothetical protein
MGSATAVERWEVGVEWWRGLESASVQNMTIQDSLAKQIRLPSKNNMLK